MTFSPRQMQRLFTAFVFGSLPLVAFAQGSCPDPVWACHYFNGSTATPTGGCLFAECFDMSYSEASRAIAVGGDETLFTKKFHLWTSGTNAVPVGTACTADASGNKWKIALGPTAVKCQVAVSTPDAVYYEHFVSNPTTGCLAWLECKVPR